MPSVSRRDVLKHLAVAPLAAGLPRLVNRHSRNDSVQRDKAGLLREQAKGWHIIVVMIDAATAKHMSLFGYHRKTDPNIRKLAESSVTFENAFAPAPYTISSMGSFFTGLYPHRHGINSLGPKVSRSIPTLGEVMSRTGLRAFAFSGNRLGGSLGGYERGFEEFLEFQSISDVRGWEKRQELIFRWLEKKQQSEPFLLFVHYVPPHEAYLPPPPFRGRFDRSYMGSIIPDTRTLVAIDRGELKISERDRRHIIDCYDEHMLYADHLVSQLIDRLRTLDLWDKTLFVLLSDHGEAFGEHGKMLHNTTAYDEMVWVPLIMRFPSKLVGPRRLPALICSATDLLPTLADLRGADMAPENIDGRSFLPVIAGEAAEIRQEVLLRTIGDSPIWGLRTRRFKYLFDVKTGRKELYDLPRDRKETVNLVDYQTAAARQMCSRLQELVGGSLCQ